LGSRGKKGRLQKRALKILIKSSQSKKKTLEGKRMKKGDGEG